MGNKAMETSYQRMTILDLPTYVVTHIFTYLNQQDIVTSVRKTCKLWNTLSYERALWKCYDIRKLNNSVVTPRSFLKVLASICDLVETLYIDVESLGVGAVLHDPVVCHNLKTLYINCSNGNEVEDDDIHSTKTMVQMLEFLPLLAKKYPELCSIHILGKIFDWDLSDMINIFPNLKEIELEYCPDSVYLEKFLTTHEHLQSVTLRNSVIGSRAIAAILTKLPNLETLDLSNTSSQVYDFDFHEVNQEDLAIGKLRKLCLDKTPCSDLQFTAVVKKAPKLKYLSVIACQNLTNCAIESLAENCPGLEKLYLNEHPYTTCNITNAGFQCIGEHCKELQVLKANFCSEINNIGVEAIAKNCCNLTDLSISGCTALTDSAVLTLVKHCSNIQYLDLGHCVQLTSTSVNEIFTSCYYLRYMNLETCHRLTNINLGIVNHRKEPERNEDAKGQTCDSEVGSYTSCAELVYSSQGTVDSETLEKGLKKLENHCHMRDLNLSFCSKLTNGCLWQIAARCPDLQKVDIQGCCMVTNAGVSHLTIGCKLLHTLIISGGSMSQTSRLTDDCLYNIASVCQNLQELVIVKNHNITTDGIFEVIDKCPKISSIKVTVSKRSNIKLESVTDLAGKVKGKILCIKYVGDVEIGIVSDPDYCLA